MPFDSNQYPDATIGPSESVARTDAEHADLVGMQFNLTARFPEACGILATDESDHDLSCLSDAERLQRIGQLEALRLAVATIEKSCRLEIDRLRTVLR